MPLPTFSPTDALAAFCKAAGEPLRLNILRALSNDSFGVLELAHIFAQPPLKGADSSRLGHLAT